ncbi:MAG: HNH endonuclease [Acidobacteriota bacterium]
MQQTLLLNATYEPLQVVSWKRAVRLYFQEKVEVLEVYDRVIRSVRLTIAVPAVVRLLYYVPLHQRRNGLRFSRRNVFLRDRFRCQYCGRQLPASQLTCDHVIPVARGGATTWENVVTSCIPCNRYKGNRTPEEAGMSLRRTPVAPVGFVGRAPIFLARIEPPETWKAYLFS